MIGKKVSAVIPGIRQSNPELFEVYGRVALTGIPEQLESYVPGLNIWFSISVYSTEKEHFVAVFDNITERKRAEEEIRKLNTGLEQRVIERTAELSDLYNNAPCGYHSLDENGTYVLINDTELKWLGYSREEIIGKIRLPALLTPASVKIFQKNFPLFKTTGSLEDLELEFLRKDGSVLPILLNATAIIDQQGNFLMSRSTIINHTERKHAEEALKESKKQLESANLKLEMSNKELEAFAYSVSHDLRAPLRAIDGFSRIILEEYTANLDDEAVRLFNVIRSSTKKMDELITDLLSLAKVSRSDIEFLPIDMADFAVSIFNETASPEIREKFVFTTSPMPPALADPTLMRQVWSNLLSNAVKYTLPKDERRIEVGGYKEQGRNIYFVKDSGVGFNQDYSHKLFGVFQRLHNVGEFEGTGVGLAIVQRIIQRHGGSVWAEGKIDQGAVFYFSLPEKDNQDEHYERS